MKISRLWLEKFFDTPLPEAQALADALTFHAFEIDGIEKVGEDSVFDVKITPNRGHDCLSHRGIAAELSAILNLKLAHDPLKDKPTLEPKTEEVSVTIEAPELCARYVAGFIKGVTVGPSPAWLKERLEAVGQRSINNVVDATNFVMFNTGQPLHAFDAGKLSNNKAKYFIGVRRARTDEHMTALDGKSYTLTHQNLVIADNDLNVPIGIAGVKGGMPAAITEAAKDIIIEAANFDGPTVRKSAASVGLRTDASARFEQGLSPELVGYGMHSVVELIQKVAGGELKGFVDAYPVPQQPSSVSVSAEQVQQVLGPEVSEAEVDNAFERLSFLYTKEKGVFTVAVPWVRRDLSIPEDLIEEVARIRGFEKIPARELPPMRDKPELNPNIVWSEKVRTFLLERGFSEVYTSVFTNSGERAVLNRVDSDKPYLRTALAAAITEALERNMRNADLLGLSEIRIFEIGTVFLKDKEEAHLALGLAGKNAPKPGEILKQLCQELALKPPAVPETGNVVELPMSALMKPLDQWVKHEQLALSQTERYQAFSKYPYIVRDIALWVQDGSNEDEILTFVGTEAGALLVRCELIDDTYKKDGKTSLFFRLVFQSSDRTLTEVEVNQIMEKIAAAVKQKGFEVR